MKPRDPAAEAALIADRTARDRAGVAQIWQAARRQRAVLAVLLLALGGGLATLLPVPHDEVQVRGFLWLFTVVASGISALGALRAPQQFAKFIAGAEQRAAARARVMVYDWTVRGVIVAADAEGDGIGWWLFLLPDGGAWLLEEGQLGDEPPMAWRQEVRIVLDGLGMALAIDTAGDPVPFADRAVFREELGPEGGLLFWSPAPIPDETPARVAEAALPPEARLMQEPFIPGSTLG